MSARRVADGAEERGSAFEDGPPGEGGRENRAGAADATRLSWGEDRRRGSPIVEETALAKINLDLKVVGRLEDGRHDLDSLVVFAPPADRVDIWRADADGLEVAGPFAEAAGASSANLAWRALEAFRARIGSNDRFFLAVRKEIPVGAGLGGGSGDAGAVLRGLNRAWGEPLDGVTLRALGGTLGADVPISVFGRPARMRGSGERIDPVRCLPELWLVLAMPGAGCSTAEVFAAFRAECESGVFEMKPRSNPFRMVPSTVLFSTWLTGTSNDLERAAIGLRPEIGEALALLAADDEALVARMTGSGACCWAMYRNASAAARAAEAVRAAKPDWWVRETLAYDQG